MTKNASLQINVGSSIGEPLEASGEPSKNFFIKMITRDISLVDCILDLVDNSIDSAYNNSNGSAAQEQRLRGFIVNIATSGSRFEIVDNCGGIPLDIAKTEAFTFGHEDIDTTLDRETIGLYGIGMKRAMFKLGKLITVLSSTRTEAFTLSIDVEKWSKKEHWNFDIQPCEPDAVAGTQIEVQGLLDDVSASFSDPLFSTELRRVIGRDYRFFVQSGLQISINNRTVDPHPLNFLVADNIKPAFFTFQDGEVTCEIAAGIIEEPPESTEPEDQPGRRFNDYGWWVVCNERIVLAADKTERTVWGDDDFTQWHSQYNGFVGIVHFRSRKPSLLPWTTTKKDIDTSNTLYRRVLKEMKRVTASYTKYTTARKANLDGAKALERAAAPTRFEDLQPSNDFLLPTFGQKRNVDVRTISYQKAVAEIERVAEALGDPTMTAKNVGLQTFKYFWDREVGG